MMYSLCCRECTLLLLEKIEFKQSFKSPGGGVRVEKCHIHTSTQYPSLPSLHFHFCNPQDALDRANGVMGTGLTRAQVQVRVVRDVAPKKPMLCLSFRAPNGTPPAAAGGSMTADSLATVNQTARISPDSGVSAPEGQAGLTREGLCADSSTAAGRAEGEEKCRVGVGGGKSCCYCGGRGRGRGR